MKAATLAVSIIELAIEVKAILVRVNADGYRFGFRAFNADVVLDEFLRLLIL